VSHPYIEVTDKTFEEQILKADKPAVVDCWATWCGPCRMMAPAFEALAAEYQGKVIFAKLDTDENEMVTMRYGIRSIPTLLFFRDGREVDRLIGARPREDIKGHVESLTATHA
jgi:thioredoxin 1